MSEHTQKCESCKTEVDGEIYHLGFSNMEAIYCTDCPRVLLLEDQGYLANNGVNFSDLMPGDKGWQEYNSHLLPYYTQAEALFPSCVCGGTFKYMAAPRCPACNEYIFGKGYENKPTNRNHGYAFVTVGSVSIKNGAVRENT